MISKECYVYIQLPRTQEVVTAGRLRWQNTGTNSSVGTFVYGQKYLGNKQSIPIDPMNMPLEERIFECTTNEGIFGPLRDASPDKWGRYVIEKNTPSSEWNEVGYLLNGAEDRVGALTFGVGKEPPAPIRRFNQTLQLNDLINAAHKIEKEESISESEKALLMAGASMGGARPKTTIERDNSLWLAKFPSYNDRHNISKIEYGTMKLAKGCGLRVPKIDLIKVGNQDVFLIQRFDREWDQKTKSYLKSHFVSGLTLLNLDENDRERWSYLELADQMKRWITDANEHLRELFRRMIFNSLVSNTDDHPRNHGFILTSQDYSLSEVYDLVPRPEIGSTRYSAMTVGQEGRSFTKKNLLSNCEAFGFTKAEAQNLYSKMNTHVMQWQKYFADLKLSDNDLKYLESAFAWENHP